MFSLFTYERNCVLEKFCQLNFMLQKKTFFKFAKLSWSGMVSSTVRVHWQVWFLMQEFRILLAQCADDKYYWHSVQMIILLAQCADDK